MKAKAFCHFQTAFKLFCEEDNSSKGNKLTCFRLHVAKEFVISYSPSSEYQGMMTICKERCKCQKY